MVSEVVSGGNTNPCCQRPAAVTTHVRPQIKKNTSEPIGITQLCYDLETISHGQQLLKDDLRLLREECRQETVNLNRFQSCCRHAASHTSFAYTMVKNANETLSSLAPELEIIFDKYDNNFAKILDEACAADVLLELCESTISETFSRIQSSDSRDLLQDSAEFNESTARLLEWIRLTSKCQKHIIEYCRTAEKAIKDFSPPGSIWTDILQTDET